LLRLQTCFKDYYNRLHSLGSRGQSCGRDSYRLWR